jgi:hypothetical protein
MPILSKEETAEIVARNMAALKKLRAAAVDRERLMAEAREARKKAWQLSEIARIEEGSEIKVPTISKEYPPAGYGGYLDGYSGI